MDKFLPMCAANASAPQNFKKLRWPMIASPKLDGIRCVIHPTLGPVSRNMKAIPNRYVRELLTRPDLIGLDGELIVGPATASNVFSATQSGIMSHGGMPDFTFQVFDAFNCENIMYRRRLSIIDDQVYRAKLKQVNMLSCLQINTADELDEYESWAVGEGYEGVMLRNPAETYQFRYSDLKTQALVKLKRMQDDEAVIDGYEPLTRNTGEIDERMVGKLLATVTTGPYKGSTFRVGSGLTHADRYDMAADWPNYVCKTFTFKYQAIGSVNRPRLPVFKGMRPEVDK